MYDSKSEYWRGINNSKARQAWATFLASYSWDAFFTLTSNQSSLRRHPISLCNTGSRVLRGNASDDWQIRRCFIAAEEFKLGDWHAHGLVSWDDGLARCDGSLVLPTISRRLAKIGYSRIECAKQAANVAGYLSKYVIKDTDWEYDIWGTGWKLDAEDDLGLDKQIKLLYDGEYKGGNEKWLYNRWTLV